MAPMVYFIVILLFLLYFSWVWNSSKEFENTTVRISFITIGTLFIAFITFILFLFSKINVDYPKPEMVKYVRNIILLIFVPINGFAILPQVIYLINRLKDGNISGDEKGKKLRILAITIIVILIFESIYFKKIQIGIINYINLKG